MRKFAEIVVYWCLLAGSALLFSSCELISSVDRSKISDEGTDPADQDPLFADEDDIVPTEEEPEGEVDIDQKTDKDTVVKDDGPTITDDGEVEPDDATVVTDDATVEPDDATVVTDDATVEPDDATVVTDDATVESDDTVIVTDDVATDDIVIDGDESLNDDDSIVYVDPCSLFNPCLEANRSVCTDVNLDGIAECSCDSGYHWNDTEQSCLETIAIEWCDTYAPMNAVFEYGETGTFYGRLYIAGLTDQSPEVEAMPQIVAQLNGNTRGSDATAWPGDGWVTMEPNPDNEIAPFIGEDDEYMVTVPVMNPVGEWDFVVRFSGDSGQTWTYCNGRDNTEPPYNGTDADDPYDPAKNGHFSVVTPYDDPCLPDNPCVETNRTVCSDVNLDGEEECSCDAGYTLDGGDTCINQKEVACDTDNDNPINSHDIVEQVPVTYDGTNWSSPTDCVWECDTDYIEDDFGSCVLAAGPCADSPCTDANKHVCADDGDGNPVCSCDEHYNDLDDNGTCEPDTQNVACTNELPENAYWDYTGPYTGSGTVMQTWSDNGWMPPADTCPWGCVVDHVRENDACIHEKQVPCDTDNGNPENSTDIVVDVTVIYTTGGIGDGWSQPDLCEWTCDDGYHWNEDVMECLQNLTIDWCNLDRPTDGTWERGSAFDTFGRVYIAGVTDQTSGNDGSAYAQIIGQIGFGAAGTDAAMWDMWGTLAPNMEQDPLTDMDEYAMFDGPLWQDPGDYDFLIRFSGDSGATWIYCNANRESTLGYNGTDAENPYTLVKNGHFTVTPGYADPCVPDNPCDAPNQGICTDEDLNEVPECACDEGYTFDGGSTCINEKQVDCAAEPNKPANSHDIIEQVWVYYNGTSWTDPATCSQWACDEGYHWNDTEESCLETLTINWCNLETPTDITFYRGETASVYGRVYVPGVTDQTVDVDTAPQLLVQVGSGAAGNSAIDGMYWGPMEPNPYSNLAPGIGVDEDEYQYIGPVTEMIGDWDLSVRVSGDSGATWTFCNANRAPEYNGTDAENPYDLLKNGHFTVTSPCGEGVCSAPNKSVCVDSDNEPYYTCSCDENYHDADGDCAADMRTVACSDNLPANAYWKADEEHDGEGNVTQTWSGTMWLPSADECPLDCDATYHYENSSEQCAPNIIGRLCTNPLPEGADWVETGVYDGVGNLTQTWIGPGDNEWEPSTDSCPWACTDPAYHENYEVNQCLLTYAIGWCGNMDPLSANAFPGDQKDISAELWINNLTNASTINGTEHTIDPYMPQIKAELGAGPHGTDPATWDKMWMPAIPNADIGNNDEYIASPVVDMDPGEYDYAYRFSGNSGQTWTYCGVGTLTVLCVSNDDCSFDPTNQICNAAGVCVDCDSNDDCDAWEQCTAYACEPQPGKCSDDGDCETWEQCNGSHECELAPGRCTVDGDCTAAGKVCDEPTYTCKLPGKLVINEVDYDQPGTDTAEYIELFVTGEMPLVLAGLTFEFWNGSGVPILYNSSPYDLAVNDQSVTTLNPGAYYIIAPPAVTAAVQGACPLCVTKTITPTTNLVQNGPNDALRIMNGVTAVDGLHYAGSLAGYGEGSAGPTDPGTTGNDNISIGRCPNGADTDDNGADFLVMPSTPGAANTCM